MAVLFANDASSTLQSSITTSATQITISTADAGLFPSPTSPDYFMATVADQAGNMEIMKCMSRSGGVLTVVRAQEGTSAIAFAAGAVVDLRLTKGTMQVFTQETGEKLPAHTHQILQISGLTEELAAKAPAGHAHSANNIAFTPAGSVSSTNMQSALAEMDTKKAALAGATFTQLGVAPDVNGALSIGRYSTTFGGSVVSVGGSFLSFQFSAVEKGKLLSTGVFSGQGYDISGSSGPLGVFAGNGDAATATVNNLRIASWFGVGFANQCSGQTVPVGEYAAWINVRSGDVACRGNITGYSSDSRLKRNAKPIARASDKLAKLSGYTFDWDLELCNSLGFKPAGAHEHGLLAQEVQGIVPDAVSLAPFDDAGGGVSRSGKDYLTVNYARLVPLLVQAINEQAARIRVLEEKRESGQ